MTTRREFVKTMAAGALLAQQKIAPAPRSKAGRIDVHHHRTTPGAFGLEWWTPARSLDEMGKYNIATSITSVSQAGPVLYDGTPKARSFARASNEQGARLVQDYPGKFGLFSALPMTDIEGTLKEIAYSYDTLKADGVHIYSSINEKWPGDPVFMPIYEELNRRKAIIFVHPLTPACCQLPPGIGGGVMEYDFDVCRGMCSLLWNGVLSKFADIRFIVVHSGGVLPVMAGRIQDSVPKDRKDLYPTGALELLRKQYYEIAHASFPWAMAALLKFTSLSNVMFGTDYPRQTIATTTEHIPENKFSEDVLYAIDRGNAERVFPKFKA